MQTISQNLKETETKIQENKNEIVNQPHQIPVSLALCSGNESEPDTNATKISNIGSKGISSKSQKCKTVCVKN